MTSRRDGGAPPAVAYVLAGIVLMVISVLILHVQSKVEPGPDPDRVPGYNWDTGTIDHYDANGRLISSTNASPR